jgi:hypothetical protein
MSRVGPRIALFDQATQDAGYECAKADFYADPVRYPCDLPPRSGAAAFYEKVQGIMDQDIATLHQCVPAVLGERTDSRIQTRAMIHQLTAFAAGDFIMRVELDGYGLEVVNPVLKRARAKEYGHVPSLSHGFLTRDPNLQTRVDRRVLPSCSSSSHRACPRRRASRLRARRQRQHSSA